MKSHLLSSSSTPPGLMLAMDWPFHLASEDSNGTWYGTSPRLCLFYDKIQTFGTAQIRLFSLSSSSSSSLLLLCFMITIMTTRRSCCVLWVHLLPAKHHFAVWWLPVRYGGPPKSTLSQRSPTNLDALSYNLFCFSLFLFSLVPVSNSTVPCYSSGKQATLPQPSHL